MSLRYRVTGDHGRMIYSHHTTRDLALRAARRLAAKWGVSHPGSEPRVERLVDGEWVVESVII